MEINVSLTEKLKLGVKLIGHKLVQYRLSTNETAVRDTAYGKVRGLQRKTLYDEEPYYAFEGIPFAKPPLGDLRFRAPVPPEPWLDILDCTTYRPKPLQSHMILKIVEGSEDCLYLNVYVKRLKSPKPLPVMVWIYGGGFQVGEASRDFYSPDYFMQRDIVFVAITYRLGALGFLSLKDRDIDVPGNAGLKDQVLALRWVKENIANFNGDPNNVTLFGESAGGASTHAMMLTDQARDLFHKAIIQSGSALCAWASPPGDCWPYRLACSMGYKGSDNDKEIYGFLSKANAREIAAHDIKILTKTDERDYVLISFGPVVEPYETESCIVNKPWVDKLATTWSNKIPLIIGGTSFEGLFNFQQTRNDPYMLSAFEAIIPPQVRSLCNEVEKENLIKKLKSAYWQNESQSTMQLFECLHILSIKNFWHDIHRTILARLKYAPETATYMYRFDMDSEHFNHFRIIKCGKDTRGVCHADDISYLFYNILSTKLNKSSVEYKTIERMIAMWTSFAANGDPNCKEIHPATWNPVQCTTDYKCLNISQEIALVKLPESKQFELWDSFYAKSKLY